MYLLKTIFVLQSAIIKLSGTTLKGNESAVMRFIRNFAPMTLAFVLAIILRRNLVELIEHKSVLYAINVILITLLLFMPPDKMLKKLQTCRGFLWLVFFHGFTYSWSVGFNSVAYMVYAFFWLIVSLLANVEAAKTVNIVIGLLTAFAYMLLTHHGGTAPAPFENELINALFAQAYDDVYEVAANWFVYLTGVYTLSFAMVTIKEYFLKCHSVSDMIDLPVNGSTKETEVWL